MPLRLFNLSTFKEKDLAPGERLILRTRSHWVLFAVAIIKLVFICAVVGVVDWLLVERGILEFSTDFLSLMIWIVNAGVLFYAIFIKFLAEYVSWYYDQYVLTDTRLVFVRQHYLFGRDFDSVALDRVAEIAMLYDSIIGTMLNYADIEIRTIGELHSNEKQLVLKRVRRARKIYNEISKAVNAYKSKLGMPII